MGRVAGSRALLVRSNHAFGDVLGKAVNPRFIQRLEKLEGSRFAIVSSEHGEGDANNFPSNRYRYILELWQGTWQVAERQFLGKNGQ